jgi:hypothetical protein
VALQHVRHLVAEHAGQLVLAVEERDQPACDVDVPAGKRERVRLDVVRHVELPGHVGALRRRCDPAGHLADVADELWIADEPDRALDLFGSLFPELALLAGRDGRAATTQNGQRRDESAAEFAACEPCGCSTDERFLSAGNHSS